MLVRNLENLNFLDVEPLKRNETTVISNSLLHHSSNSLTWIIKFYTGEYRQMQSAFLALLEIERQWSNSHNILKPCSLYLTCTLSPSKKEKRSEGDKNSNRKCNMRMCKYLSWMYPFYVRILILSKFKLDRSVINRSIL